MTAIGATFPFILAWSKVGLPPVADPLTARYEPRARTAARGRRPNSKSACRSPPHRGNFCDPRRAA